MADVTFPLSGVAYQVVSDGGFRNDNPRAFAAVDAAPGRKIGKGVQYTVTMSVDDAYDLADYLESVAEVWACMTLEERGTRDRPAPLFKAVERIRMATGGRSADDPHREDWAAVARVDSLVNDLNASLRKKAT